MPPQLTSGPWKGVYDTNDPFDANPGDRLRDLVNGYIPDPKGGSSAYARPGFLRTYLDNPLHTAGDRGQAIYEHTMLDGTVLNFAIIAGRLMRITGPNSAFSMTLTDVTPVGVAMRSDNAPIFVTSCVSNAGGTTESVMIINDCQNRPWIASNLTGSPVTGAYIDYDGLGTGWLCYSAPVVWKGAVFFPNISVGGVYRGDDMSWSEPGRPDIGYQQSTYDNNLTLVQHSEGALEALCPTNAALYYFRANSIGVVYGELATLATTATFDAVSYNVGTLGPLTIQRFGNAIYFCDRLGRPHRFIPGSAPEPIWKQMRGRMASWSATVADSLRTAATSAIDPLLNLYLVVLPNEPKVLYAFDATTGVYMGRWSIFDDGSNGGIVIDRIGVLGGFDVGSQVLFVIGENTPGGAKGYAWAQHVRGWATENNNWMDGRLDAIHPNIQVKTDRLSEDLDAMFSVDRVAILTGNAASCKVSVQTASGADTIEGTPSPATSNDGTYRLVVGCDGITGRGPSVTVAPQFTDADQATLDQWSLARVAVTATPSLAGPEDA